MRFSRDWEGLRLWRLRIVLFLVRGFILGLSDARMGVCTYRQLLPVFLRPSCRHRVKGEWYRYYTGTGINTGKIFEHGSSKTIVM